MTNTQRPARSTAATTLSVLLIICLSAVTAYSAHPPGEVKLPAADSFRAYDLPSDDGSEIVVEWDALVPYAEKGTDDKDAVRRWKESPEVIYVVEIASEEDFANHTFKEVTVSSWEKTSYKWHGQKFFGFSNENKRKHYVSIEPAAEELYKPTEAQVAAMAARKSAKGKGVWANIAQLKRIILKFDPERDARREVNGQTYYFRLAVMVGIDKVYLTKADWQPVVVSARAEPDYYKSFMTNNLVFSVLFCSTVLGFIQIARRNPNIFIRRISGLDAVDEALGRATEMGRPVFFVHGLGGISGLSTIAALSVLGRVARRVAEYDLRLRVTNVDPITMAVSQEVVKQAFTEAGRPDAYNPDNISLVATDQFSYTAAVGGRMMRERPAAIFLMGYFFAESLILAETGAATGAIQISGTDAFAQLPFFVTSCDYTLIGEELFAASAYMSREPLMLGSLRGQDVGKLFLMIVFVTGTILATCGVPWITHIFKAF